MLYYKLDECSIDGKTKNLKNLGIVTRLITQEDGITVGVRNGECTTDCLLLRHLNTLPLHHKKVISEK